MQAFAKIKKIFQKQSSQYIQSIKIFDPIDLDKLAKDLKIEEKASQRGALNKPDHDNDHIDNVEQEIIYTLESELSDNYHTYLNELEGYNSRLSIIDPTTKGFEINSAANNAMSEFNSEVRYGINHLELAKQSLLDTHQEKTTFVEKNNITRTANYPDSKTFYVSLILLFLLIECVCNTNFFAIGSSNGLIGGFFDAFIISALNIFVGFGVGRFAYTKINHVSKRIKLIGITISILYFAFLILFNFFVAHYRIALSGSQPENAGIIAVNTALTNLFNITDFNSCILVGLGLLFSIISSIDGYNFDDPYPGYGNIDRKYKFATEEYMLIHAEVIDNLKTIKDEAIENFNEAKEALKYSQEDFNNLINQRNILHQHYLQRVSYLNFCLHRLLSLYRDKNIEKRTVPAPKYFFNTLFLNNNQIKQEGVEKEQLHKNSEILQEAYENLNRISTEMHQKYTEIQNNFPLINELIRKEK